MTTEVYIKYCIKAVIIPNVLCCVYQDSESMYTSVSVLCTCILSMHKPRHTTSYSKYRMFECHESHIPHEFDILENKLAVLSQNCIKLLFTPLQRSASVTHTPVLFFPDKVKLSLNFMLKSNGHDVMV